MAPNIHDVTVALLLSSSPPRNRNNGTLVVVQSPQLQMVSFRSFHFEAVWSRGVERCASLALLPIAVAPSSASP